MITFKTIQLLVLGLNFSASGLSAYLSYKISRIDEVKSTIWILWSLFFLLRFISYASSVFFLVQLDISRNLFGNTVTIASWIYGAVMSVLALCAVTATYRNLKLKFPWIK